MERGFNTLYYHADGLGSIVALTDPSGAVVERYIYDAFGNATITDALGDPRTTALFNNPYLYTSRELDPESGLYYYRARYYDAGVGRFLGEDDAPLILDRPEDLNQYSYVSNNPLIYSDPNGLQSGFVVPTPPILPNTTVPQPGSFCPTGGFTTSLPKEGECRLLRVERGFGGRIVNCIYLCKHNGIISQISIPPSRRGGCEPILKRKG